MKEFIAMKKHLIPILFFISLLPVFGLVWFLLSSDDPFLITLMNTPIIGKIIFITPSIWGFFSFAFYTNNLLPPAYLKLILTLISIIPLTPSVLFAIWEIRNNNAKTIRKTFILITLFFVLFFSPILFRNWSSNNKSDRAADELSRTIEEEKQLLAKAIKIEYMGITKTQDIYYDNGEIINLHTFSLFGIPDILKQMKPGMYKICFNRERSDNSDPRCLIQWSLNISSREPRGYYIDDFMTEITMLNLERNLIKSSGHQVYIILPGIDSTNDNEVGYLHFVHLNSGQYNNKTIYSTPIRGPLIPIY